MRCCLPLDPKYGFWRTATPTESGIDEVVLRRHIELCVRTGADAQVVICGG